MDALQLGVPAAPTQVIKTADLTLGLPHGAKLSGRMQQAAAIAEGSGGWVESSSVETSGAHIGTAVLRIPAAHFEAVMGQLEGLGKVRAASHHGQDVSRQLVDLSARLVNLKAQRHVLLGLMNRAQTIDASIKVENQLSAVQGQIEQIQGEQRYLHDRAALGTITLTMSLPVAAPPPAEHPSALRQALSRAVDATQTVVTAVIVGLGFILPIALIGGLVLILVRRFWPALLGRPHIQMPDKGSEAL